MAGLFPRIAEKCNPSIPSSCCSGRRAAVRSGRYYWDSLREGWVDSDNPKRSQTLEAFFNADIKQSTDGQPYLIEICGFCGCEMSPVKKHQSPYQGS